MITYQNTNTSPIKGSSSNQVNDIDVDKLLLVFKRSIVWCVLIFGLCILVGYLYLRYTKPLYESSAEIKLDIKSEASTFGFNPYIEEQSGILSISGEIELIRSKLFLTNVIESLPLEVSYFYVGNILDEEKYRSSPFEFAVESVPSWAYDRKLEIVFLNNETFTLNSPGYLKNDKKTYSFNQKSKLDELEFKLTKNESFGPEFIGVKFYVIINSNQSLLKYIESNLSVAPQNISANTIKISFTDHNRNKALDMVGAISNLYTKFSEAEKNRANQQKIDFLNEQLQLTEKKLEEFENYFEEFTIDNRTVNLQSDLSKIIQQIQALDSSKFLLQEKVKLYRSLRQQVQKDSLSLYALSSQTFGPELGDLIKSLNELLLEREIKKNSYSQRSIIIQRLDGEIRIIKDNIILLVDQQISQLAQSLTQNREQRSYLERNFIGIPAKSTAYNKNRRFYSLFEDNYLSLIQKKNEFEIARAGTVTKVYILSPATAANTPISPKPLWIYGGCVLLGGFLCVVFVVLGYAINDKISGRNELERISEIPLLGVVPRFKYINTESNLVVMERPRSSIAESFRNIRANTEFMLKKDPPHVISVTSTIGGEGKTFVGANLAGIIALSNKKVIVIDMDMRKPNLHNTFSHGSALDIGLSTYLIGKHSAEEVIKTTQLHNLDFLPSGPIPPNPAELLITTEFEKLIVKLKENYDYIIIDTPPIGLVTDAIFAIKKADLPIYVIRAEYSRRPFLKTAEKLVEMNGFNKLSFVLNADTAEEASYGYKHGYYSDNKSEKKGFLRAIFQK